MSGVPLAELSVKVDKLDKDLFISPQSRLLRFVGSKAAFGGQVVSQALTAASSTVNAGLFVHSLHCYFLLPGDLEKDIIYFCKRVRDGRSFSSRIVNARQDGKTIFILMAQFHIEEPSRGLKYHQPLPLDGGDPGLYLNMSEFFKDILSTEELDILPPIRTYMELYLDQPVAVEQRIVHPRFLKNQEGGLMRRVVASAIMKGRPVDFAVPRSHWPSQGTSRRLVWMRSQDALRQEREDALGTEIHKCVLAYMSDMGPLGTALELGGGMVVMAPLLDRMASLDHSMWFHSASGWRCDDWLLFEMIAHRTGNARATIFGKVWCRRTGELICSLAQEGLLRMRPENEKEGRWAEKWLAKEKEKKSRL